MENILNSYSIYYQNLLPSTYFKDFLLVVTLFSIYIHLNTK